jgi:hypothetical protein
MLRFHSFVSVSFFLFFPSQLADPSGELRYLYQARAVLQQAQQVQQEAMQRTQQAQQNKLKGPIAPNRLPRALQEPGDPRGTELMEVARQLFRDHVQLGGITGHVSANELLTLFMGEWCALLAVSLFFFFFMLTVCVCLLKSRASFLFTLFQATCTNLKPMGRTMQSFKTHPGFKKLLNWLNTD